MKENEDFDEVLSDVLIELHDLEARVEVMEERMKKMESRMDFAIKRIVKIENRLDVLNIGHMEMLDFKQKQLSVNKRMIDYITNKPL